MYTRNGDGGSGRIRTCDNARYERGALTTELQTLYINMLTSELLKLTNQMLILLS